MYYTVLVEMSSSKGFAMKRGMLRRFRDFIRLHQGLLGLGLNLPTPPPKLRLRAVNTSSALIEQRRRKLQEWLWSLVSIPRVAQSRPMALFLELEAHSVLLSEEEASAQQKETADADGDEDDERRRSSSTSDAMSDVMKEHRYNRDEDEEEDAITEEKEEEEEDDEENEDVGSGVRRRRRSMTDTRVPSQSSGGGGASGKRSDEVDDIGGPLERRDTPLTVSSSRTSPARSIASTLDGVAGGSTSSSAVTVIPAERQEALSVLVSDVTKKANRAMEMILCAEQERCDVLVPYLLSSSSE